MEDHKFFGEWVHYLDGDEKDKQDAKLYLELWRRFIMRKLEGPLQEYSPAEGFSEQWVDRPSIYVSCLKKYGTLGLKMCFTKKKLPGELT
jgi:hypothetical protein